MSQTTDQKQQEKLLDRARANISQRALDAARERVPDIVAPEGATTAGARNHLKTARRHYATKNPMFNRATRRQLAREVRLVVGGSE